MWLGAGRGVGFGARDGNVLRWGGEVAGIASVRETMRPVFGGPRLPVASRHADAPQAPRPIRRRSFRMAK